VATSGEVSRPKSGCRGLRLLAAGTGREPAGERRRRWCSSARVAGVLAVLAGGWLLLGPAGGPMSWIFGTMLALVLPGLALREALGLTPRLTDAERVMLVPVCSLAVLVGVGLALHVAEVPLRRPTWSLALVAVTLVGAVISELRWPAGDRHGAAGSVVSSELPVSPVPPTATARSRRALLLACAVALLGVAITVSVSTARKQLGPAITTLSAVAAGGAGPDAGPDMLVTLDPHEPGTTALRLIVRRGGRVVLDEQIPSSSGASRTWRLARNGQDVRAELFRQGEDRPYRTVFVSGVRP